MRISAVIPTRNRPADLQLAVMSLLTQSKRPNQVVIIDQSDDATGRDAITAALTPHEDIALTYVLDPAIAGLVAAKAASLAHTTGELVCFFEDDVVVDPLYLEEMDAGFVANPGMQGCSGIITNATSGSAFYRFVYRFFHRGVFTDRRPDIYASATAGRRGLVPSNIINGGLSAWRRTVFETVRFDVANGFHMMEDSEFSTRVSRQYPRSLFVNMNARLEHFPSPINRGSRFMRQHRKVVEYWMFYKKNKSLQGHLCFGWLLVGLMLDAALQMVRERSSAPIRAFASGVLVGARRRLTRPSESPC